MRYSYTDIRAFFEMADYPMQSPRAGHDYINSSVVNNMGFVIYAGETEVAFCWQVKKGETVLDDKLPEIQKRYTKAETRPGTDNPADWTRLFIPLDQQKLLVDTLEAVEKTKAIVGYGA